jgi:hypothetical protein
MWPFTRKHQAAIVPAICVKDIRIEWNLSTQMWEFQFNGLPISLGENPVFNTEVLTQIPLAIEWLEKVEHRIDQEIAKQFSDATEETGKKKLQCIDASWLIERCMITAEFTGNESWGGAGLFIVLQGGEVKDFDWVD